MPAERETGVFDEHGNPILNPYGEQLIAEIPGERTASSYTLGHSKRNVAIPAATISDVVNANLSGSGFEREWEMDGAGF